MNPDPFLNALRFTLAYEGGIANVPGDRGGLTNQGITQATYDARRKACGLPRQSVRLMTTEERDNIYRNGYWLAAGCDRLPPKLALCVFDTAVHSGPGKARAFLAMTKDPARYVALRRAFLNTITAVPSQRKFRLGFMNRMDALLKAVS